MLSLLILLAPQQFRYAGPLPGEPLWTEGVEPSDVDLDGDWDLFFAEGDGFDRAGPKRANVLLVNQLLETGEARFEPESEARLGGRESNAKMVFCGDVDGDGYPDAVFANAFRTDPPFLYVNRGLRQPGFFDEEGSRRGLFEALNSSSGQFGDVDGDGDLDLALCDSGEHLLGGDGGRPRLYLNDGRGYFLEADRGAWEPPVKVAHVDVQWVDVDGDHDLDFLGANRGPNEGGTHYLLVNDGEGSFTDASPAFPPTSRYVYEIEAGDLDGDSDLDFFLTSLTGMTEGSVRTDGSGLSFLACGTLTGSHDDNEVVLLDHDNDGDLDVFVASLGRREAVWRNEGGHSFEPAFSVVEGIRDSSLDATVCDVDGDGDYDLITAQGESNRRQYHNKLYLNEGSRDTLGPRCLGFSPTRWRDGRFVLRVRVQDQFVDDGRHGVTGRLEVEGQAHADGIQVGGGLLQLELPCAEPEPRACRVVLVDAVGNRTVIEGRLEVGEAVR